MPENKRRTYTPQMSRTCSKVEPARCRESLLSSMLGLMVLLVVENMLEREL